MEDDEEMQEQSTACNDEVDEARSPDSRDLDALDHQRSSQEIKYHISTQFTNEELKNNRRYEMNHAKRGMALLFTHGEFQRTSLPSLPGTAKDGSALCATMKTLGFEVYPHQDKTWTEMKDIFIQGI
ncbi:hypothetical protein J437_LFUL001294 [Ladona fulva]|uniref:Caspase family p20 domain-containing protein n=1 Tax=Ladona fulva TaxID=123851 RepID=A0A8K0NUK3_LADFU|nr:hypothetical protein J437_LFUL001294 [Ladona fulva]